MLNYICLCHAGQVPRRFTSPAARLIPFNFELNLTNAGKWKNVHRLLLALAPFPPDAVFWFPDPDLQFPADLPPRLFAAMRSFDLDLAQPAVTKDSVCAYPHLFQTDDQVPRQVPHVEIMCPLFSYAALKRNLWTFDLNYSGFGIDLLWGRKERCYVLDWLPVRHPSSPGYNHTAAAAGFPDPNAELAELRRLYL